MPGTVTSPLLHPQSLTYTGAWTVAGLVYRYHLKHQHKSSGCWEGSSVVIPRCHFSVLVPSCSGGCAWQIAHEKLVWFYSADEVCTQGARADVKLGSTHSVLFPFQKTFIPGSQKAWWGLKPSAVEKQRYGKLYDRLSWASHLSSQEQIHD